MSNERVLSQLVVPALRAQMGDWIYYVTFLKFRDVAERVHVAEEIHRSDTLNELIQRRLTPRAAKIRDYLIEQPQRFFNSLVIGLYGGEPEWYELDVKGGAHLRDEELPEHLRGAVGFLVLRGDESLFAIDGQHRVAGIREAVQQLEERGEEEVSALFVGHSEDDEGLRRTRRLFSTLNRYAKPVAKKDIIALDEDDVVAILTRELVERHPLFQERVSLGAAKAIARSDRRSVTSIVALYDVMDVILRDRHRWNDFKRFRPTEEEIQAFRVLAFRYWELVVGSRPALQLVIDRGDEETVAAHRTEEGGHVMFRPVGMLMYARCCDMLQRAMELPLEGAIARLASAPMDLTSYPWADLLWDTTNKRMITASENQRIAQYVLFLGVGGEETALPRKRTWESVRAEWAGLLNRPPEEIEFPDFR